MSIRNFDALFRPKSIAVIGASNRPRSIGSVVMRNLLAGGFEGPIVPVNPNQESISGVLAYPDIENLPITPDLAVICTPAETVIGIIRDLAKRGTRAAVVLSAGISRESENGKGPTQEAMLKATRSQKLRILGPNTVGLLVPGIGLNASFAHTSALSGRLAFVGQSGGLATAILDIAHSKGIGFSSFVSLGDIADIDFGDALDYLGSDPGTDAILLYIESIRNPRKFMSAARAAARQKIVIAIKAGRVAEGARAAASHTGAIAGSDEVFEAALQRAGVLRVIEIDELFDAVETLGRFRKVRGDRLGILTNSGGPAVIATDALISSGGHLASLSQETIEKLDNILPDAWSHANPVDIIGDAPGQRYGNSLRIILDDPSVDAALVMNVPTAVAPGEEAAQAVADVARHARSNVLTSWLGGNASLRSRRIFAEAGLPTYDTPDKAVRAFMHLVRYRRNQELLMETPPSVPEEFSPDINSVKAVVKKVIEEKRELLTEPEAKGVLAAYDIPTVETRVAADPDEAARIADELGYPVALKILSPDISHKSDVGGVVLNLQSPDVVRLTAAGMESRLSTLSPNATLSGFTVQRMARMPRAHELILGVTTDSIFGPVILFGQGGTAVELVRDRAMALPPLNMSLTEKLIGRTRVSRLLRGYRNQPAADIDGICLTLLKVSQLIVDIPEIAELDINPLLANDRGVLALDARIQVAPTEMTGPQRLAIRPFPQELEEKVTMKNGRKILLRPIRPEDEALHHAFLGRITPEDIRFRFFAQVKNFTHEEMTRFTQIDYDRQMAFIASGKDEMGNPETLGVVRASADHLNSSYEFAIVVRSDIKGQGLGRLLMDKMIRYARDCGGKELTGDVLRENIPMLGFMESLGFKITESETDSTIVKVTLNLASKTRKKAAS